MNPNWKKFAKMCIDHDIAPTNLFKKLGISVATATDWKHGRFYPKADKIKLIADYFGVDWTEFYVED